MSSDKMNLRERALSEFLLLFTNNAEMYKQWMLHAAEGELVSRMYRVIDLADYGCGDVDLIRATSAVRRHSSTPKADMLAELVRYYGQEMAENNVVLSVGNSRTQCVIDCVVWYNTLRNEIDNRSKRTQLVGKSADVLIKDDIIVEETNMNTIKSLENVAVTTAPIVFGTVITGDTPDSFFLGHIRALKQQIDDIKDVQESTKMQELTKQYKAQIKAIVKLMDSRVSNDA